MQQARNSSLLLLQHTQAEATALQKLNETFRASLALLQSRNNYHAETTMHAEEFRNVKSPEGPHIVNNNNNNNNNDNDI